MEGNERKLLDAIHNVEKRVVSLETKIDDSVTNRFNDNERRITALESNQRWVVLAVIGSVIAAIMSVITA